MKYIISYRLTGKLAEKATVVADNIVLALDELIEELLDKDVLDRVEYIGVIKEEDDWDNPARV